MVGFHVDTADLNKAIKEFSDLGEAVQKKIFVKVLKNNTRALEGRMKTLAPVSPRGVSGSKLASRNHPPGYLKASIGTIVGKKGRYPTIWIRPRFRGKWDPWYEHFPMAGTKKMKVAPNPFVDNAWKELGAQVEMGLKTDLEKQIQAEINKLK